MEKQAEAIRVEQIKLYESYADGVLLRDAYIEKKKALSEKLAALQDSIRTEKEEQECADELDEEIRALTKQASEKTYIGGLTKECVDAFVSMVYYHRGQERVSEADELYQSGGPQSVCHHLQCVQCAVSAQDLSTGCERRPYEHYSLSWSK